VSPIDNIPILFNNYFMSLTVKEVIKKTPAKNAGVISGDLVYKINDIEMNDFIDDTYANSFINPTVLLKRNERFIEIKLIKSADEGIGLVYKENLYPDEIECSNGCVFCFVDQLPKGMRNSLYVRDDDWRYSVLYGNYITMTNMSDEDFSRIATRKVSPLYISVHATDPEVRYELMRNKKARDINKQLEFLYENQIHFHSQIVLCPGVNDGEALKKTIEDMAKLYPYAKTLSVVPVGLTTHRRGLPKISHVDMETARTVINLVNDYRNIFDKKIGEPFVYISDEFYSKAKLEYPRYKQGEINAQKANGVGLFSDFLDEFEYAIDEFEGKKVRRSNLILVTGVSAYKEIKKSAKKLEAKFEGITIEVIKAYSRRFGESITVAGLLTGYDIIEAVGNKKANAIFVPESALRDVENVFLDDMTVLEVEKAIGSKVMISPNDGYEFVKVLIGDIF